MPVVERADTAARQLAPPRRRTAAASRSRTTIRSHPGTPHRSRRREPRSSQRPAFARRRALELAPEVGERVPDTRHREGQEAPARVDALAEARDDASAHDSLTRPAATSATRRRVEFVPRSTAATRVTCAGPRRAARRPSVSPRRQQPVTPAVGPATSAAPIGGAVSRSVRRRGSARVSALAAALHALHRLVGSARRAT